MSPGSADVPWANSGNRGATQSRSLCGRCEAGGPALPDCAAATLGNRPRDAQSTPPYPRRLARPQLGQVTGMDFRGFAVLFLRIE
jgi:hypothetical protein